MMKVMRHLLVPNKKVQDTLTEITKYDWLSKEHRIFSSEDGKSRLIPLSISADINLPNPLSDFEIIFSEGKPNQAIDTDWWNHLEELVGKNTVIEHQESWPSSHEFFGDMMIVRIDDSIKKYTTEIARAKLLSHPFIRLVLSDSGVMGELRIRDLKPIGARKNSKIYFENIPSELTRTKVSVKESGKYISCDPKIAYYSTKLQSERLETLRFAKELRKELNRPLAVCDPFCGVGPALSTLIGEEGLVDKILASDLNEEAVKLLFENLQRWDKREYPSESTRIQEYYDNRIVGLADATKLSDNPEYFGKWDLVLVNLPHRTIEFLPRLIPLLNRRNISLIRGRVIVAESEISSANEKINQILPPIVANKPKPELKIKRDYSSALRLCSFEAWIDKEAA
tara:strand:- start:3006 stop:4196 length:1191 start_codon:yes stop_codon:yes gene_type:complete